MENKKIDDLKRKIDKLNYAQFFILEIVITFFLVKGWNETIPARWVGGQARQ